MPELPPEILKAIEAFWNNPASSDASRQALHKVADYCAKHSIDIWKVIDKSKAARAVGNIIKNIPKAQKAIQAGEGLAAGLGGEAGVAGGGEIVAGAMAGETSAGLILGMTVGQVAFVCLVVVAIICLFAWAKYKNDQLEQMGRDQDRQRIIDRGLNYAEPPPGIFDPRRAGRLG